MSPFSPWYLIIGAILVSMALVGPLVRRLPVTPAIVYLALGYGLGSGGADFFELHPVTDAALLRTLTEIAVSISLFAVGLKLRAPLSRHAWRVPLRLGLPAMVITILILTAAAWLLYGWSLGVALLAAAILAPTDPVLGSDVQTEMPGDRDFVRFGLTGEGGLNDGLAYPAVFLGLGLLGRHDLGHWGLEWLLVDTLWFVVGGLLIGWWVGILTGRLVIYLRSAHSLALGLEEFLGIGVIALAFGLAGPLRASEFLAVFAAGVALRHLERETSIRSRVNPEKVSMEDDGAATDPDRAPAHMTRTLLTLNGQAEHIAELALVMVLGCLLASVRLEWQTFALAAVLFLVARPVGVAIALIGCGTPRIRYWLLAWFGIRGIGCVYYLAVCLQAGIAEPDASRLFSAVLAIIALSIVIHGVSATPLMQRYYRAPGG